MKVLMIDVGGTSVKLMVSGHEGSRKFSSGRTLTAAKMMQKVRAETKDWDYDVVSLGYPGIVRSGRVDQEPHNLADGWVGFDFESAFEKPVRVINDAAMQALANYEAGRLLFLGLGTSVGATLIADDTVVPLEIGMIPISKSEVFFERLGRQGLHSHGRTRWQKSVERAVQLMRDIFWPDHFQLGGGNAKYLEPVPEGCICGSNRDAFYGAERLWPGADMLAEIQTTTLRIIRTPIPAAAVK
ncbi:MAG: ROK family protein [Prosthecobacter sp.]